MYLYGVKISNKDEICYPCSKGGDNIKGRLCYNCYNKKSWTNFLVKDDNYSDICKKCSETIKPVNIDPKSTKYILYLHPSINTHLYKLLDEYWCCANLLYKKHGIVNECIKYPFHITLTSFFKLDDETTLNLLIKKIIEIKQETSIKYINIGKRYGVINNLTEKYFRANYINSEDLIMFCKKIQYYFPFLNVKNNLHLSLYNNVSPKFVDLYEKLLLKLGAINNKDWDLILWKTDGKVWNIVKKF